MLNLAPSTVSRALNDSYEISQATKDRVQELAKSLHYQPNPFARSLRAQKSKTIAVIIPAGPAPTTATMARSRQAAQ